MTILDLAGDVLEFVWAGNIPGPATLEGQRRARLIIALLALSGVAVIWALVPTSATLTVVVLLMLCAAASVWTLLFSIVDLVKEPGQSLSVAVVGVALVAIAVLVYLVRHLLAGAA